YISAAKKRASGAAEASAQRFAAAQRTPAQRARQMAVESRQPRVSEAAAAHNVELLRTARGGGETDLGTETSPGVDQAPAAEEKPAVRRHATAWRKAKQT